MIRKIIKIDEEKCNGCGLCADAYYRRLSCGAAVLTPADTPVGMKTAEGTIYTEG